jgi:hypothetical protein
MIQAWQALPSMKATEMSWRGKQRAFTRFFQQYTVRHQEKLSPWRTRWQRAARVHEEYCSALSEGVYGHTGTSDCHCAAVSDYAMSAMSPVQRALLHAVFALQFYASCELQEASYDRSA